MPTDRQSPPRHPVTHWATAIACLILGTVWYSMFLFFMVVSLSLVVVLYPTCLVAGWATGRACEAWRFLRGDPRDDRSGSLYISEHTSCH